MKRPNTALTCDEYARMLISDVLILGHKKTEVGEIVGHVIRSVGTARSFRQCVCDFLNWRVAGGMSIEAPITRSEIVTYLHQESKRWRQKTLDQHRQALSLVFCLALARFDAEIPTVAVGRAYSLEEMELVAKRQTARNALATRIAFHSGLRAAESLELREQHELTAEANRPWRSDLFLGSPDGVIYRTRGKGGLARSVLVPVELHEQLQMRRLDTPVTVIDREVRRTVHFDVGGGQNLSQSFSAASDRALGYSMGFHGLRHAYAQGRLETLLAMGLDSMDCLEIVSQILGHRRLEISLAYTTRRKSHAE